MCLLAVGWAGEEPIPSTPRKVCSSLLITAPWLGQRYQYFRPKVSWKSKKSPVTGKNIFSRQNFIVSIFSFKKNVSLHL
jgi:hypothetical protein